MLIEVEDALDRTLRGVAVLGLERVALEAADNRVLGEDLVARRPIPLFSNSAMDGYAARASFFTGEGPWSLRVVGESRAGLAGPPLEQHGTACRIFTGAPVPQHANTVIIQEDVTRSGDRITVAERPREGQNIRPMGSDLAAGTVALEAGQRLHPGRLGLVASLDRAHVVVARRPVVTLLSTGDELRPPGALDMGSAASIPESNSSVLAAIAMRLGAVVRVAPLVVDDPGRTEAAIRSALGTSDLLVTVGGASVGDHDLVQPALERIGVTIDFWGVKIKPGKPTGFGRHQHAKVLALPGNPASAALTFLLFGTPLLRAMQGDPTPRPRRVPLRVIGSHSRRPGREEYLRARLELHDGELCAVLPASQSSGAVTSFAAADALVVLAADRARIDHGDRLPTLRLVDLWS